MTQIKLLPRTDDGKIKREFYANGNKYTIRSAEEGLGIYRFSEMQKISAVVGFNAGFQQIKSNLDEIRNLQYADEPAAIIKRKTSLYIDAINEQIVSASKDRFQKVFFMCTLFIVREGEDLTKWNKSEAQSKIEDWNKESYNENDFLALALISIPSFMNAYQLENQRIEKMTNPKSIITENLS